MAKQKVIPLVQCNVMYERYHFFGPPCTFIGLYAYVVQGKMRKLNYVRLLI